MKGYILIDIPKNCKECPIGDNKSCIMETYISCPIAGRGAIDAETETLPAWCPIKPLPEKYEVCGKYPQPGPVPSYRMGWNACLDKFTDQLEREKEVMAKIARNARSGRNHAIGYVNGLNRALDIMRKENADETTKETD